MVDSMAIAAEDLDTFAAGSTVRRERTSDP